MNVNSHVEILETDPIGRDRRTSIRVVHVSALGNSPSSFYEMAKGQPVIIRGVYDHDPFLSNLSMDIMRGSFQGRMLEGFNTKEKKYGIFKAEDVFEDIQRAPQNRSLSVVDHPIEPDNDFGAKFQVPAFFQGMSTASYMFQILISPPPPPLFIFSSTLSTGYVNNPNSTSRLSSSISSLGFYFLPLLLPFPLRQLVDRAPGTCWLC